VSKSTSRRVAPAAAKVVSTQAARIKTSVYLPHVTFKRLGACCLEEGMTQSDVVAKLIDRHLSGYYVSVKGAGIGDSPSQPSQAAPANTDDRREGTAEISAAAAPAAD